MTPADHKPTLAPGSMKVSKRKAEAFLSLVKEVQELEVCMQRIARPIVAQLQRAREILKARQIEEGVPEDALSFQVDTEKCELGWTVLLPPEKKEPPAAPAPVEPAPK